MVSLNKSTLAAAALAAGALAAPPQSVGGTQAVPLEAEPAAAAAAADPAAGDGWKISLWSYGWLAGLEGTTGIKGITSEVDVPFSKILDNLDMTASMNIEAQRGRWGGWIDAMYLKVSAGGETPDPLLDNASLELKQVVAEAAIFYRVWDGEAGSLDVYGGARYMRMDGELNLRLSDEGVRDASEAVSARVVDSIVASVKARSAPAIAAQRSRLAGAIADKAGEVLGRAGEIAAAHPGLITAIQVSPRLREALRNVAQARLDEQAAAAGAKVAAPKPPRGGRSPKRRKRSPARSNAPSATPCPRKFLPWRIGWIRLSEVRLYYGRATAFIWRRKQMWAALASARIWYGSSTEPSVSTSPSPRL
ncbi:MAG: hypothetical protein R3F11_29475 [Verrucomicrobiales bacterium]